MGTVKEWVKEWEREWYLKGFATAASYFKPSFEYRDSVLKAQWKFLLESREPIDSPFLTGLADGLTSAHGA